MEEAIRAEVIQEIISSSKSSLKTVAKKHKLGPDTALALRQHWTRVLFGKCVDCKASMKNGECPNGHSQGEQDNPAVTLLQQLNPKADLIVTICSSCKTKIPHSAEYVLRMVKTYGGVRPFQKCRKCKDKMAAAKQKRESDRLKRTAAKVKKITLLPTEKKVNGGQNEGSRVVHQDSSLTHRPFEALEGLKVKKQ